jgi:NADH-quinone oxidoreductase subunit J
MVLFLFVIMLLSIGNEHLQPERRRAMQYVGVLGALGVLVVLAAAISRIPDPTMGALADPDRFGTVKAVGHVLYTQFLLPFEVTSLLLLVAIVGAVVVAKEKI